MSIVVDVQICEGVRLSSADYAALTAHIEQCVLHASATTQATHGCITVRLVGREESAQLNLAYRQKNAATNVLSFPYDVDDTHAHALDPDEQPLGDLVICVPVVSEEAAEQGKTEHAHYAHMVVHGVLHLFGFDHEHDEEAERMESVETQLLSQLGVKNPYQLSAG